MNIQDEGPLTDAEVRELDLFLMDAEGVQRECEAVVGTRLDKSSFRRRLRSDETLVEVAGEFEHGANRPAQLYRAVPGFRFNSEDKSCRTQT